MVNCNGCVNLRVNGVDNTHFCVITGANCYVKTDPNPGLMRNGVPKLGLGPVVPEVECDNQRKTEWDLQ